MANMLYILQKKNLLPKTTHFLFNLCVLNDIIFYLIFPMGYNLLYLTWPCYFIPIDKIKIDAANKYAYRRILSTRVSNSRLLLCILFFMQFKWNIFQQIEWISLNSGMQNWLFTFLAKNDSTNKVFNLSDCRLRTMMQLDSRHKLCSNFFLFPLF